MRSSCVSIEKSRQRLGYSPPILFEPFDQWKLRLTESDRRVRVRVPGIENFADRRRSVFYGTDDPLGNIIGMDVMQHFLTQIRPA